VSEPRSGLRLFDIIASQRRFIYLAVALLSAGGIWSAFVLPSSVYPELNFQRITVVAQGSSLAARQQVFAITRPIEEAVSLVPGVTRVQSRSIRGSSEIPISFAAGTDMPYALQLVRTRVEEIRGDLPPGLDIEIERMTPTLFPVVQYNIEGGDPATLYDIARYQIKPIISRVPGVGRVDVQGCRRPHVRRSRRGDQAGDFRRCGRACGCGLQAVPRRLGAGGAFCRRRRECRRARHDAR
jgi:multidrug efflux pump subunit AcrB